MGVFSAGSRPTGVMARPITIQLEPGRPSASSITGTGAAKLSSTRESLPRGGSPTRKCGGESHCTKRLETIWPCAELWDDDSIHGAGRLRLDVPPAGLSGVCVFGREVCRNAFSRSDELAYRRVAYEGSARQRAPPSLPAIAIPTHSAVRQGRAQSNTGSETMKSLILRL